MNTASLADFNAVKIVDYRAVFPDVARFEKKW